MSQQKTKFRVFVSRYKDVLRVTTDSPYQTEEVEGIVRVFLNGFEKRLPEHGYVIIQWERVSPSTTTPPESS